VSVLHSDQASKADEDAVEELMKLVEVNDPASIFMLANYYEHGGIGLQQDHTKAIELFTPAADLGYSKAHFHLANFYQKGGDLKKATTLYEAAAWQGSQMKV
jgi:TPR repeat protein